MLDDRVAPEPQDQPRRVLPGRELDDHEHARHDEPGERDHPRGRRAEDVARAALGDVEPDRRVPLAIDQRREVAEDDRDEQIGEGDDDEAPLEPPPQAAQEPGSSRHRRLRSLAATVQETMRAC